MALDDKPYTMIIQELTTTNHLPKRCQMNGDSWGSMAAFRSNLGAGGVMMSGEVVMMFLTCAGFDASLKAGEA